MLSLWAARARQHPLAATGFVIAALFTVFFAVRLVVFTVYWADPGHRQQAPEPWMTPRYIAHSWGLDPADVALAVGQAGRGEVRPTLERIAKRRGVPVETVLNEVRALIGLKAPSQ